MSAIILPPGYTYEDRSRLEVEAIVEMSLRQRYDNDARFREIADEIHGSRMAWGPSCYQCMGFAERRMSNEMQRVQTLG